MVEPSPATPSSPAASATESANSPAEEGEDLGAFLDAAPVIRPAIPPATATVSPQDDEGDDVNAFMENAGVQQEKTVCYKRRPWMDDHKFVLVKTIDELRQIVDAAIAAKRYSLDLETGGLDNRIYFKTKEELSPDELAEVDPDFWTKDWTHKGKAPVTVHKIVGYCLSYDGLTGYYVPVRHTAEDAKNIPPGEAAKEIRRLCKASQPTLTEEGLKDDPLGSRQVSIQGVKAYFWHAKFDQEYLYPVTGIEFWHPDSFEDGNLLYFCRYTGDKNLGLKDKSAQNLRTKKGDPYEMIEIKELFVSSTGKKREVDFASLHPEEAYEYGCSDGICTFLLCEKKENQDILRDGKDPKNLAISGMYRLEKQVAQTLRGIERPRIMLDIEYVKKLFEEAVTEAAGYEQEVKAVADAAGYHNFDIRSSKQLSEFLFTERGLNIEPKPEVNEKSGQYKTDADTLEKLVEEHPDTVNPVLKTIVKFRQIDKVVGTYLQNMVNNCDANHEIRYQFKQTGAATARFSAPAGQPEHGYSGVPIHGIPATYDDKKPKVATSLRKAFKARPGYTMVKVDFAGEELRIATNLSGEPVWVEEFLNGTGDLHSITARAFFNKQEISKQERQAGKMANFSLLYGGGAAAIIRATGCTQVEAQRRKQNFDKALPTFAKWVRNQKALCHKEKGVWTAFRRWIAVPEIDSQEKPVMAGAERAAVNYPVQGSGADIMKIAMVLLYKEFYRRRWLPTQDDLVRMLLTVHDEIVFEVKHEALQVAMGVIVELMQKPGVMAKWRVPLIAEPLIDLTWDAKYDWDLIVHGKEEKDIKKFDEAKHVRWNGRVYGKVPSWLVGLVRQPWEEAGETPPPAPAAPQSAPPTDDVAGGAAPAAAAPPKEAVSNGHALVPKPSTTPVPVLPTSVETFRLSILTKNSVRQVASAVMWAARDTGPVLEVLYAGTGEVLVSASHGLRVDPVEFQRKINEYNL